MTTRLDISSFSTQKNSLSLGPVMDDLFDQAIREQDDIIAKLNDEGSILT